MMVYGKGKAEYKRNDKGHSCYSFYLAADHIHPICDLFKDQTAALKQFITNKIKSKWMLFSLSFMYYAS
jgi:hypothetical protein